MKNLMGLAVVGWTLGCAGMCPYVENEPFDEQFDVDPINWNRYFTNGCDEACRTLVGAETVDIASCEVTTPDAGVSDSAGTDSGSTDSGSTDSGDTAALDEDYHIHCTGVMSYQPGCL